jgi:hypothetical protein
MIDLAAPVMCCCLPCVVKVSVASPVAALPPGCCAWCAERGGAPGLLAAVPVPRLLSSLGLEPGQVGVVEQAVPVLGEVWRDGPLLPLPLASSSSGLCWRCCCQSRSPKMIWYNDKPRPARPTPQARAAAAAQQRTAHAPQKSPSALRSCQLLGSWQAARGKAPPSPQAPQRCLSA